MKGDVLQPSPFDTCSYVVEKGALTDLLIFIHLTRIAALQAGKLDFFKENSAQAK